MSDWQEHVSIFLSWNHLLKENQLRNLYLLQRVLSSMVRKKEDFMTLNTRNIFMQLIPPPKVKSSDLKLPRKCIPLCSSTQRFHNM